jgi:hypothetical protein
LPAAVFQTALALVFSRGLAEITKRVEAKRGQRRTNCYLANPPYHGGGIVRNLWFGRYGSSLLCTTATLAIMALAAPQIAAQTPQLQQSLAEIKQAVAANRQALTHYTWLEQQTIIVKGAKLPLERDNNTRTSDPSSATSSRATGSRLVPKPAIG